MQGSGGFSTHPPLDKRCTICYIWHMDEKAKALNLRDLPADFLRRAKSHAALSGLTLKDFVIQAVEKAMQDKPSLNAESKRRKKK
jgi:hypothetical protein